MKRIDLRYLCAAPVVAATLFVGSAALATDCRDNGPFEPWLAGTAVPLDQLRVADENVGVKLDKNDHADARYYRPAVGGYRPAVGYYRPAAGYYRPAAGYYRPY